MKKGGARRRHRPQRLRFVLEEIGCVQWHMLEAPAGIAKRANPSCALKQTFRLLREHTRLAGRWAGKACRRGSLRWLLLRASVSCDAQQLNRHQPPSPKMAKRVLALLVEVATCQLPLRPRHNRLLGRHGLSTVSMQPRVRPEMQSRIFSNTLRERNVTKCDNAQIAKTPYSLPSKKTASPHLPA